MSTARPGAGDSRPWRPGDDYEGGTTLGAHETGNRPGRGIGRASAWRAAGRQTLRGGPATPRRLAQSLGGRLPPPGARIGLLGGSFNPAHGGHRHICEEALQRLGLDEVWWLVSPQNPLKPRRGMASLSDRLASASRAIGGHPRLFATDIERIMGTLYTADTLAVLTRRLPRVRFVWLMGADNLAQIARWDRWTEIFESVPIAVLDRPSYSMSALYAKAAERYRDGRLAESAARRLAEAEPPAWVFLHQPQDPRSATRIRARLGGIEESLANRSGERNRNPGNAPTGAAGRV